VQCRCMYQLKYFNACNEMTAATMSTSRLATKTALSRKILRRCYILHALQISSENQSQIFNINNIYFVTKSTTGNNTDEMANSQRHKNTNRPYVSNTVQRAKSDFSCTREKLTTRSCYFAQQDCRRK